MCDDGEMTDVIRVNFFTVVQVKAELFKMATWLVDSLLSLSEVRSDYLKLTGAVTLEGP